VQPESRAKEGVAPGEARGPAQTHFADRVLMEPVTSMSPARNSWYFVQAIAVHRRAANVSKQLAPGSPGAGMRSPALALPGRVSRARPGPAPRRSPRPRECAGAAQTFTPLGRSVRGSSDSLLFFFEVLGMISKSFTAKPRSPLSAPASPFVKEADGKMQELKMHSELLERFVNHFERLS
jgi:hypothetical protein